MHILLIQIPGDHRRDAQNQAAGAGDNRDQDSAQHHAAHQRRKIVCGEQRQRLGRRDIRLVDTHEHSHRNATQTSRARNNKIVGRVRAPMPMAAAAITPSLVLPERS